MHPVTLILATVLIAPSAPTALADETTYELEPVVFSAEASFESLGQETFVPKQSVRVAPARYSILKRIGDEQAFPLVNQGYPSGAKGPRLGGRSVDDVQVTTIGVPLNLPQGGGADLSVFPSFLWSAAELSRTPISAGYTPSAASGAVNLKLWTREKILRAPREGERDSRLTFSADRQVQNFSIATRKQRSAINVGTNFGLQTGPAGSLSYEFYRDSVSTYRLHLLGTDQDGDSPGSKTLRTPEAHLYQWRMIPAIETQRLLGGDWVWESTWFADLGGIRLDNPPSAAFNTSSRSQQFGVENAFVTGDTTLSLSARYTRFRQEATAGAPVVDREEWPYLAGVTRRIELSDRAELKATAQASGITGVGVAPGARLSARVFNEDRETGESFFELFATPKQPTIQARFYQLPFFYSGNPDLRTERIYSAIAGFERRLPSLVLRTTLKGEYRTDVQIDRQDPALTAAAGTSIFRTVNAGTARLLYLDQQAEVSPTRRLDLRANVVLTLSRLQDSQTPYPDLSAFSARGRAIYHLSADWDLEGRALYQGPSVAFVHPVVSATGGRFHPNFTLFDLETRVQVGRDLQLQAGIENLTNQFAEVVLDYPLPGRIYYFGAQIEL